MRCLLDTNVLLRGLDRKHPMYRVVRRAIISLRRQGYQLCLTSQNLIEFWSVATRPVASNGLGMSVHWAAAQLARMKRCSWFSLTTPRFSANWKRLVVEQNVSGKRVHDATGPEDPPTTMARSRQIQHDSASHTSFLSEHSMTAEILRTGCRPAFRHRLPPWFCSLVRLSDCRKRFIPAPTWEFS